MRFFQQTSVRCLKNIESARGEALCERDGLAKAQAKSFSRNRIHTPRCVPCQNDVSPVEPAQSSAHRHSASIGASRICIPNSRGKLWKQIREAPIEAERSEEHTSE